MSCSGSLVAVVVEATSVVVVGSPELTVVEASGVVSSVVVVATAPPLINPRTQGSS
jgi:hypothetical protein